MRLHVWGKSKHLNLNSGRYLKKNKNILLNANQNLFLIILIIEFQSKLVVLF